MVLRVPAKPNEPCRFQPGGQYSVKLRGMEGRQRISVEATYRQRLGDVRQQEVIGEGWKTRSAWRADWVRRHDRQWYLRMANLPVLSQADLCRRFSEHWADRDCWVIRFSLVEPQQFLARQQNTMPGKGSCGQYTSDSSRSIDMLPVVPPDPAYVKAAALRAVEMRESLRADIEAARARKRADRGRMFRQPT